MKLQQAQQLGENVMNDLGPLIEKGDIAGSIRRKKLEVRDIDIIILPKKELMILDNIKSTLKKHGEIIMEGDKIIRAKTKDDIELDCYIANEKNYEVLLLIRTGSKEYNRMLAIEALKQGKKLNYSDGLIDLKTKKVIASSEKGIFEALGIKYIEPEKREIKQEAFL